MSVEQVDAFKTPEKVKRPYTRKTKRSNEENPIDLQDAPWAPLKNRRTSDSSNSIGSFVFSNPNFRTTTSESSNSIGVFGIPIARTSDSSNSFNFGFSNSESNSRISNSSNSFNFGNLTSSNLSNPFRVGSTFTETCNCCKIEKENRILRQRIEYMRNMKKQFIEILNAKDKSHKDEINNLKKIIEELNKEAYENDYLNCLEK